MKQPHHLLMAGDRFLRSSAGLSLAGALERRGFQSRFSRNFEYDPTREWLASVRWADAIVLVNSMVLDSFRMRQFALAATMGRPVVRWWIGSDVLRCLEDDDFLGNMRKLDRFVALNLAAAPHLVEELASVGIRARFTPSVIDEEAEDFADRPLDTPKRSLLVYLPTKRRDFYGQEIVRDAIREYPDIDFLIVADDEHALKGPPNVRSLGWVDNMEPLWSEVGGVLRITQHDGLPRMVLKALLRGKYVIYSWPLPGCWLAKTRDDVFEAIDRFREVVIPNQEGREEAVRLLTPDPTDRFAEHLRGAIGGWRPLRRIAALRATVVNTMKVKWPHSEKPTSSTNDSTMPLQLCYVLTAEENGPYPTYAYISMASVRRIHPDAEISLLTDQHTSAVLENVPYPLLDLIDRIVVVDVEHPNIIWRSRFLKTSSRKHIEGDYLFLDVDTLALRRLDVILDETRLLGATTDCNQRHSEPHFPEWHLDLFKQLGWRAPLPSYYSSGMIAVRDDPTVHAFFQEWHRRWLASVAITKPIDQPAFNSAIDATGIEISELPRKYHAVIDASPRFARGAHLMHIDPRDGCPPRETILGHLFDHLERTGEIDFDAIDVCRRQGHPWGPPFEPWRLRESGNPVRAAWLKICRTFSSISHPTPPEPSLGEDS